MFLYQKHRQGGGGRASAYEALLEHVVALVLEFIFDELRAGLTNSSNFDEIR
jgi:hypothetical protein